METQTQSRTVVAEVNPHDVFVLVLVPQNMLDAQICGRTISRWVDIAVSGFTHRKVEVKKTDDIITIVKNNVIDTKYCVVVYADTPLLTRTSIDQALSFVETYKYKAAQMPRGWVFYTEYVKKCINIDALPVPNLPEEDFIVAYNYNRVALAGTYARTRINNFHTNNGVIIADPYNVYIDADVKIGKGTRIGPGVILRGESKIGNNCNLTNFVEVKRSVIGDGTKISHMSSVADATVGRNCNIGPGVVFASHNGRERNTISVGNGVFIGSNANLVAPLSVGDNAYIAVGSTITQDIPAESFGIGRARQAIKENWRLDADD